MLLAVASIPPSLAHAAYTYTDIDALTPSGTGVSRAFAINSAGTIVGDYAPSTSTSSTDYTYFTYSAGTLTPFATVNGSQLTYDQTLSNGGRAINDLGIYACGQGYNVVASVTTLNEGYYNPATSTYVPVPISNTYANSSQIPLSVQVRGINNSGLVVGIQYFASSTTDPYANGNEHGVIYNPATQTTTDIGGAIINPSGNASSGYSYITSVSDNGSIIGSARGASGNQSAYVGVPGSGGVYTYTDLTSLLQNLNPGYNVSNSMALAISDNGKYVVGNYSASASGIYLHRSFEYTVGGSAVDLGTLGGYSILGTSAYGVNDSGQVVGSSTSPAGQHAYLYSGGTMTDLNTLAPTANVSFTGAQGINDAGQIVGFDSKNGGNPYSAFLLTPQVVGAANIAWNNGGVGDGRTWDTTQLNFNNGAAAYNNTSNGSSGDIVTFNDSNNGNYNVAIPSVVSPSSTVVNTNSSNGYFFNGSGGIGGSGSLTKLGTGLLTLAETNTYTGATNISGGTVVLTSAGALPSGTNLTINGSGTALVSNTSGAAYALRVGTLNISGGTLDLKNNDLIVHAGALAAINGLVQSGYNSGKWNGGTGIVSSAAASASNHLTALGVIINDNGAGLPLYGSGGTIALTFGQAAPVDGDLLVKYTYYGDSNLDGKVTSADYTLIDNGYLNHTTGWVNGDFNYDGLVNGSDYTLIDNAFNFQAGQIAAVIAGPDAEATAQIAGPGITAVPEPTTLALLAIGVSGLAGLSRRKSKH